MRLAARVAAVLVVLPVAPLGAQGGALRPPEALTADGVPPVPAIVAEQVRRYTEARPIAFAGWHPVRREMLVATRSGNTVQVHQVAQPGAAPVQLTRFDEPVTGASYAPTDGRYLVFAKDVGGNEFSQLYRQDLASGSVTLLTDGGRSQNGGVAWSRAGDRVAFGSTRRNGADRDLFVMDPADPATTRSLGEFAGGGWAVLDWSPDDRTLLVNETFSIDRSRLWAVDVATGARTALSEPRDGVVFRDAAFAPDGERVYLLAQTGGEFTGLHVGTIRSREWKALVPGLRWDVEAFALSRDGRWLAFTVNEAGVSRLYLFDTTTRQWGAVKGVPQGIITGLAWRPNAAELGFTLGSARSPGDAYSFEVSTGALTRWTQADLGGMVAEELAEPALVRWPSFDGLEITGFLYRPPARFTGKRPVVISIHGGPEGQSRPGFIGASNYYLNELGIAILYPNVRGSTGFGRTFLSLDNGMKREDSVKDIGALLDWIAAQPDLDAGRVLVTGGSYGGYMTLAVATTYDDRICCSVDVVGISNFNTFLQRTEAYRRDLRRVEYSDERDPAMAAFFERIAPLNNAARITKPLYVVQGGNDPRVPRSESDQMVARVRRNGSPVWYLVAADEGHGFRKKRNVDWQFWTTVAFVRTYLLGETLPAAALP